MVYTRSYARRFAFPLLTVLAGVGSFPIGHNVLLAQDRAAFTVTIQESALDRSGKTVRAQTVVFAVRGDGSTVRARTLKKPGNRGAATQRLITDLARAEEVSIDDLTDSINTVPLLSQAVEFHRRPAECTSENPPVRASLLGYEVVRDVKNIGSSQGRIFRKEEWRAPALDCFPLKDTLFLGRTEADLYIAKVDEVLQVTLGEPSASLFERPAGYFERSPLQWRQEFARRYPGAVCPTCGEGESYDRRQSDRAK